MTIRIDPRAIHGFVDLGVVRTETGDVSMRLHVNAGERAAHVAIAVDQQYPPFNGASAILSLPEYFALRQAMEMADKLLAEMLADGRVVMDGIDTRGSA